MQAYVAGRSQRQSGFTLIEIMVVVVIIGLLASIVAPAVIRQLDRATITRAEADIKQVDNALMQFRYDHYRYPTEDEGLMILTGVAPAGSDIDERKLVEILDRMPRDPWDRVYLYRNPGDHGEYDIYTLGADGREGGEGVNADIGNWSNDD